MTVEPFSFSKRKHIYNFSDFTKSIPIQHYKHLKTEQRKLVNKFKAKYLFKLSKSEQQIYINQFKKCDYRYIVYEQQKINNRIFLERIIKERNQLFSILNLLLSYIDEIGCSISSSSVFSFLQFSINSVVKNNG